LITEVIPSPIVQVEDVEAMVTVAVFTAFAEPPKVRVFNERVVGTFVVILREPFTYTASKINALPDPLEKTVPPDHRVVSVQLKVPVAVEVHV
jgi:hypothetical protein